MGIFAAVLGFLAFLAHHNGNSLLARFDLLAFLGAAMKLAPLKLVHHLGTWHTNTHLPSFHQTDWAS